ncbi:hypothetical protein AGR7A_pAt10082 [Agrobacterium deltaense NCPPB 1641]|uniref:Uncharacterized protein n=1 Tax=Agrobacterium deltaense NCPPB 1641 TaxID=1183425 RepID=A0A1S7U744_9HYPH|nr:hypothetical protein AGR7A_pAt10082 [Agrobacterium deltaense NCPPB 1641]
MPGEFWISQSSNPFNGVYAVPALIVSDYAIKGKE